MDRHSEVEAKFDAQFLTLDRFHRFIASSCEDTPQSLVVISGYKAVQGRDTYYDLNGNVLRFRQGDMPGGELTYKARKSQASIADRVEINVRLHPEAPTLDTMVLIQYLGGKEVFEIKKTSYIYHLTGNLTPGFMKGEYAATLALYDVFDDQGVRRRFLEVEIEASSLCDMMFGRKALDLWVEKIQTAFKSKVQGPLNSSLYELYSPKGTITT